MADVVMKIQKESTTLTTTTNSVVLKPALQKQVKELRAGRELGKQAKEMSDNARQVLLQALGQIDADLVGTDAKGKRLIAVKVIPSSEKIDF
jgi:transposase